MLFNGIYIGSWMDTDNILPIFAIKEKSPKILKIILLVQWLKVYDK